jgi:hypothetical protein
MQRAHGLLLGALATPVILRRRLDAGMAEQLLYGDEIDIIC